MHACHRLHLAHLAADCYDKCQFKTSAQLVKEFLRNGKKLKNRKVMSNYANSSPLIYHLGNIILHFIVRMTPFLGGISFPENGH